MKISVNLSEDKEFRAFAKDLIKDQVTSVARQEIQRIVQQEIKEFVRNELGRPNFENTTWVKKIAQKEINKAVKIVFETL